VETLKAPLLLGSAFLEGQYQIDDAGYSTGSRSERIAMSSLPKPLNVGLLAL